MLPAINTLGLLRVPACLSRHSVEPLEMLGRCGLSPNLFSQAGRWLPRDFCLEMVNRAAEAAGAPCFGAEVGTLIRLEDLGDLGNRIGAASTLGSALAIVQNETFKVHRGSMFRLDSEHRSITLRFGFLGEVKADPQHFILGTLAVLRNIALLAGEPDGVGVRLSISRPATSTRLEEFLGDRLEFSGREDAIIIDRDLLSLPCSALRSPMESIPVAVANLIGEMLPDGEASLRRIARRLDLTERTLQRKLDAYGVTFMGLLDVIRRDEAIRLVRDADLSFAQVAQQLGYSEQANFNHAFCRWTGVTPGAMRAEGAATRRARSGSGFRTHPHPATSQAGHPG